MKKVLLLIVLLLFMSQGLALATPMSSVDDNFGKMTSSFQNHSPKDYSWGNSFGNHDMIVKRLSNLTGLINKTENKFSHQPWQQFRNKLHQSQNHGGNDVAPVPEPSTLLLLGAGLIGLFILKNRRSARA